MGTLTEADKDALARMPEGWFDPIRLPHLIRSPAARCKRLQAAGMLDWRVAGEFPHLKTEYCKRSDADAGVAKGKP